MTDKEKLKQFLTEYSEKMKRVKEVTQDVQAFNKSFTAWLETKLDLKDRPEQVHLSEIISLALEKFND